MEFPAKVDTWFTAVFYGSALAMMIMVLFRKSVTGGRRIFLFVVAVAYVGVGIYMQNRSYVVDGSMLYERDLLQTRLFRDLSQVRSVRPSSNPRGSKAASLDRLRIETDDGDVVFIAVQDQPGFMKALADNSALTVDGDALVRGPQPLPEATP